MNIEAVKKMTDAQLWGKFEYTDNDSEANEALWWVWRDWANGNEHEAAARLRADIERRGMQVAFMDNLRHVIPAANDLSVIYLTSGIAVEYLFRLCDAKPREVAEAYLMTVSESEE